MINKINGNVRFTAIQDGGTDTPGGYLMCFYEKKEDMPDIDKAVGVIEFADWETLNNWIGLMTVVAQQIDRGLKTKADLINNPIHFGKKY